MSIPESFESADEYFKSCLNLFQRLQNFYKHPNVKILTVGSLETIPCEGLENLDILDQNITIEDVKRVNSKIKEIFDEIDELKVYYDEVDSESERMLAPVGFKKKHEIVLLAKEIDDVCRETGCDTVVDFGSGLGYLDQLIHSKYNYNVLGLECHTQHCSNAKKRQKKYHPSSYEKVKYIEYRIAEDSDTRIQKYVKRTFKDSGSFCVTGLHACADLTIDAMNLFLKMADAKSMVLMSCCYHKMAESGGSFKNFPLSSTLKALYDNCGASDYLSVPFLRLAAQPGCNGESLKSLVFNLMARCVLQFYADKHNYKLVRTKRKPINMKAIDGDFESYVRQSTGGFGVQNGTETLSADNAFDLEELRNIWRHFTDLTFRKAAILILLQRHLQPVCENFVLLDRIVYLKENGYIDSKIRKVMNEKISPRCLAMYVTK